MNRAAIVWLASAFIAGFLAVGLPYWQVPYSQVSLPDALIGLGLVVVGVAATIARAVGKCRFLPTLLVVGAAVPSAVMLRVLTDVMRDATSHNLWPIELIIAAAVGLLAASAGALVGSIPVLVNRR